MKAMLSPEAERLVDGVNSLTSPRSCRMAPPRSNRSADGFDHLLGSGAACYQAFDQIYRTPVPVIAAVDDFCMGLGVGLVGSCDILIASTNARFGLPEVDNGALGCASHPAKLVPPLKLRQMVFTCEPVSAQQLFEWGTVYKLTEPDELMEVALDVARQITLKRRRVVRAAKQGLNDIDTFDLPGTTGYTNLVSTFLGIKAVVPSMQQRGGGSIINLSSPQGFEGREGMAAYTASKFGVRGLTRTTAIELGRWASGSTRWCPGRPGRP